MIYITQLGVLALLGLQFYQNFADEIDEEDLQRHLSINNCLHVGIEHPEVIIPTTNDETCITVTNEQPMKDTYFDNERFTASNVTLYTVFQGYLNSYNNTPQYCFDQNGNLKNFTLNFDSDDTNMTARIEITPCRVAGFWTNGKVFCSPPECSKYLNQPESTRYFEEELYVTLNMKDLEELQMRGGPVITQFHGAPDHRLIYNVTSNTTQHLSTEELFALCREFGPCYKGRFLSRSDLFYLSAGYPPLSMRKNSKTNSVYIGVRYDPRPFVYIQRSAGKRCFYSRKRNYGICSSPSGYHSWRKLWQHSLPYPKEWLSLHWYVRWSYKEDCVIRVTDTETKEMLVDFTGPCGRYVDMKMGIYPYGKVGIYGKGLQAPLYMRFRDIKLIQRGPIT